MTALNTPFAMRSTEAKAGVLALLVHGAFLLLLVFGVSWQNERAEPVMVDVWQALPEPPAPKPVKVQPAPAPEPAAREEAPQPAPDIALEKKKAERQEKARQAELDALAQVAREAADKKQRDARQKIEEQDLQRRMIEESLASDTRQVKQLAAQAAAARRASANASALAGIVGEYKDKISAKVRGNTRLPENLKGNPQVKFQVSLLPTGEVLSVRLVQGSGNPAYDDAVERAIVKSSPLPLPDDREARAAFVPAVVLGHRPKE